MKAILKTTILLLSLCLWGNSHGQSDLGELLKGKTKLREIMAIVDAYYAEHESEHPSNEAEEPFESDYLHWKRWEWYMSGRLGHGGELVNVSDSLMRALSEKERMPVSHDRNINSNWSFVGPSNSLTWNDTAWYNGLGRVDRIVFHPTNANIIFVCTPAGGLWNTLNGGTSWNNLTDQLPSTGISGFVISYDNTSDMYLLTGDGDSRWPNSGVDALGYVRYSIGVLKSTDGGISWHQTGAFPQITQPYVGYALEQSPTDPQVLLAATSNGVYRTTDGGVTWNRELSLLAFDVKFKPGDGTRAYAAVRGDIWLSTNSGDGWTSNSTYDINPSGCNGRTRLGVSLSNPNAVYLLSGPSTGTGQFCGIWLSTDSGLSFNRQSNTPNIYGYSETGQDNSNQTEYCIALTVSPYNSTILAAGGATIWKSNNSGSTWTHVTSGREDGPSPYIHPDIHDLAVNVLNGYLYAATDGGFYRSTNFGTSWTNLSAGLELSMFYHMEGWDGDANKLIGGLQDNGVAYRSANSTNFYHISRADGYSAVFNPDDGTPLYGSWNAFENKFLNNGQDDIAINTPSNFTLFKNVVVHNTNPDTLFYGTNGVYRSLNAGGMYNYNSASAAWALISCPSNNNRFYCAGGNNIFDTSGGELNITSDLGSTWTDVSQNPGFPSALDYTKITDIAVRPTSSATVWASFGGFDDGVKVYLSTNSGGSWTNMSANLPNIPINCLAIDNANGCYAGTDIGVFYRSATMSLWMPWSNGFPNVPVTDLVIFDNGTTKKIRAATYGRGIFQSDLASTCDAAVVVTGNLEGIRHYEASTSISSTGFIQGGIGTFVSYKAGSYINLTEGFNVVDDSEFLGFISPCGEGGIPSLTDTTSINRSDPNSQIILLRRMWDPEDGLPYGSIKDITLHGNSIHVKLKVKKTGHVELVAARDVQEHLVTLYATDNLQGVHELDLDISALPKEFHYLILFYEGKVVHFQELDLR